MYEYRIHYLSDADDANWRMYQSSQQLVVGDVIKLAGDFHHVVCAIKSQKTGTRIDVSKSAEDRESAILIAQQDGYI